VKQIIEKPGPYPFRLLETGCHDGYYNMGLDEALLESLARGDALPCLRFYGWTPPAVSIGYFQRLDEEVDLEACKKHAVDTVRRISGGGAVFHHTEFTYSIIVPNTHPLASQDLSGSYALFCGGIIEGLRILGLDARFAPINDVLVGGRKISGNAQTRRMGCILQHGTVLLDNDVDLMFELLKVPSEKIKGRFIEDVKSRVTDLRSEGISASFDEVASSLAEGFRRALDLSLEPASPDVREENQAKELAAEKFSSREWLFRR
jgi:lipoate-protein ligase A